MRFAGFGNFRRPIRALTTILLAETVLTQIKSFFTAFAFFCRSGRTPAADQIDAARPTQTPVRLAGGAGRGEMVPGETVRAHLRALSRTAGADFGRAGLRADAAVRAATAGDGRFHQMVALLARRAAEAPVPRTAGAF